MIYATSFAGGGVPMKKSLILLVALSIGFYSAVCATVIHVPGDYDTIQGGINAGSPGDTVLVAPGTFYENVHMAEGINLFGSGPDKTVIDGGGITDVIFAPNGVTNYVIDGFEVRNSHQGGGSPGNIGIFMNPSSSSGTKIVRNCYVHNNGHGIQIWNDFGGTAHIENNVIVDNIYDGFDPYLGTTYLTNNTIVGNGRDGYHDWAGGGAVYIENNIFAENGRYGIFKHQTTPVFISYNDVWNNVEGAYYQGYSGPPVPFVPNPGTGEISEDPQFLAPVLADYYLRWLSACIDAGRPDLLDPDGTRSDMGAIYFDQSIAGVIELYPHDTPIIIPSEGGSMSYAGGIFNLSNFALTGDLWIMAELPSGLHFGPVRLFHGLNVAAYGGRYIENVDEDIPGGAPPGLYKFIAYVGLYDFAVLDSTYFTFEKAE
jgi:hypothetical protein